MVVFDMSFLSFIFRVICTHPAPDDLLGFHAVHVQVVH